MKRCFKCGLDKPLSEFYTHRQTADGHLGRCKQCTKEDVAERYARKMKEPEWREKELERQRIKTAKARQEGKIFKSPGAKSKWARLNRAKRNAQTKVTRAIVRGELTRSPCMICGATAHAHHEDYSKPLEVTWLCTKHHAARHIELRQIRETC